MNPISDVLPGGLTAMNRRFVHISMNFVIIRLSTVICIFILAIKIRKIIKSNLTDPLKTQRQPLFTVESVL